MDQDCLKRRTKEFAKSIITLCRQLPHTQEAKLISYQIFRSGTSIGANYRATCRGKSKADFTAKLAISLEEADETLYWLEILRETHIVDNQVLLPLMKEVNELVAILAASIKTARTRFIVISESGNKS